jgi:hypothetical protein
MGQQHKQQQQEQELGQQLVAPVVTVVMVA